MPVEWVVAGLVSIIGTLSAAVGVLWRDHRKNDATRDADLEASKGATATALGNVNLLVPAVTTLTEAVKTVDERAEARYENIQKQSASQHTEIIKVLRRRRPS